MHKLKEGLPHLYGNKFYSWQKDFFYSQSKRCFITAANQVGKSSIQIAKVIDLATNPDRWQYYFNRRPRLFLYLYPSRETITSELETKWVPEFLPRGEFKKSDRYGWKLKKEGTAIKIEFNSGIHLYFKSYTMKKENLQANTVDLVACDEELPFYLYSEINARLMASNGPFSMVFTATLGQDEWRRTMEVKGEAELFKKAFKRQVSLYDCLSYADGTKSHWTRERITEIIAGCANDNEVQRRVYGKFIVSSGLEYPGFTRERNVTADHKINKKSGNIYAGVDLGSGETQQGHPSAIIFVWVNNAFTKGRVFLGWRGDGLQTTAGDVLNKYIELKGDMVVTEQWYDYSAKDFGIISNRTGVPFNHAEKARDKGSQTLNTLFKTGALKIFDDPELEKLCVELCNLRMDAEKTKAKDDFVDALRYACVKIPWNWEEITGNAEELGTANKKPYKVIDMRMEGDHHINDAPMSDYENEIEFWNNEYGN